MECPPVCTRIESCRVCGDAGLEDILGFGAMPLANDLLEHPGAERPSFPLTLSFCPGCTLLQIRETVDPELLFAHYLYRSSFSDTMIEHARREAHMLIETRGLGAGSLVVEVASNDGYLLRHFIDRGVPVLGIEPARNIAAVAMEAGIPTRAEFFGLDTARRLVAEGVRADCLLGNNVLAHVSDLNGFVAGAAELLRPDGVAVYEVPYVGEMIEHLEFDTIYHEHLCYFSLAALDRLFERNGLRLVDAEPLAIHGGSVRVFAEPAGVGGARSDRLVELMRAERSAGLVDAATYRHFAERVGALKRSLVSELEARIGRGQVLAAYGASAKGSTLMNACGIGSRHLSFVADRSTLKQGRWTPGNALPIVPPSALLEHVPRPDAVLLLTWNFAEEIARQQRAYLESGGEFIVPVPEVRSLGSAAVRGASHD